MASVTVIVIPNSGWAEGPSRNSVGWRRKVITLTWAPRCQRMAQRFILGRSFRIASGHWDHNDYPPVQQPNCRRPRCGT